MFAELKPDIVVHAAAERRPDVCEGDEEKTDAMNGNISHFFMMCFELWCSVGAVWTIASEARKCGAYLIYISTDYVFDGSAAPYAETAPVHPINKVRDSFANFKFVSDVLV